jgi:predicted phage tail protein
MKKITGSGGGKGGGAGRSAQEAANTLRSAATVRVVEVVSEGEIVGIAGGAKGIYINNTPLQASDDSYNFPRAAWDYRVGLPNQDYMKGFSATQSEITIGTAITTSTPVSHTTSASTVDAVNVTMQLPQGLYIQDTTNGDLKGTTVSFVIEKKLTSSGSWLGATTYTIDGKTTTPYERQYRIDRPAGTGTWDIRVSRTTADATLSSIRNNTTWSRMTEIQEIKDVTTEYNDTAVIGMAIDAETVGNQIPTRAYLVKGVKIQIPSNYDPVTRVYTGTWDGTFQTAWTDNTAWVLYDLITNDRYGLGEFITPNQVDKYSFYDAAVYNDAGIQYTSGGVYVSGGISDGSTGFEPRFTFNAVVSERQEAFRLLQMVAGAMRSTLVYFNGLITVIQDRPASPVKLITKANVIDGIFDYKSTGLFERHTAINVTYNDRTDRHLQHVTTIDASTVTGAMSTSLAAAQTKYGYNPTDVAAYGATTESQAIRQGRWALDTELNQTEMAAWKMSLNGFDLMPGDIVKVYDEDYAATVGAGRIVSVSGTTVVLDRAVTLTSGSTIEVLLADGVTLESIGITQTSGTLSTVTVASGFSQSVLAGADYIVTTTVAPRQFKIISVRQDDAAKVTVESLFHDPNKYSRVETGLSLPTAIFSNALVTVTSLPTNLAFRESSVNIDNTIKRSLLISWGQPATGIAAYYSVAYRCNTSTWTTITNHNAMSYELVNIQAGTYDVKVFAHSAYGNQSAAAAGTYTINAANGGTSTLNAPTTLVEQNGGGTAFVGYDLNFKWTNPASNATVLTADLRDFEVRIIETTGSTTVRTYYVAAVAAGSVQSSSYTYTMNLADSSNVPRRNIKVEVRCRDSNGNLSAAVQTTFGNVAPAIPSNILFTSALRSVKFTYDKPTDIDYAGILVWGSTSSSFVTDSTTLIYDGSSNYVAFNGLNDLTAYYYKIATYDTFGKDYSGTGLNVSPRYTVVTSAAPGVNKGTTNPGSGTEGDVFFNTTDGQLYRYHSGAWTLAVPTVNLTGTVAETQIAAGAVTTNKLAAGAVTANEIAANTITAGKIAAATITSSQIAAGTIVASNIASNTITGDRIAAGTVTASNIDSRSLSIKDAGGTVIFAAGTALDFSLVGGTTKPADNATVGATIGTNLSGQITSANASTFIAAAAIGSAQVGTLTATNLTVGALSNTINGTTSTGARVEIAANVIRVYDSSNVLRVKLGNLA